MSGVPLIDFSPLGDLPKTFNDARDRATLADLGAILADPNADYRQAAGLAAKANRLDLALPLIAQARQREAAATAGPLLSDLLGAQGQGANARPAASLPIAPPSTTPNSAGIEGGPDQQLPRGLRNNNPLNIEAGVFTQSQPGFAGSDGRYARFETPQHGVDAAARLIDVYAKKYGLNTIKGIVERWAPANENDPRAYAASVAGRLGIEPDQPLNMADPNVKGALLSAMAQFENGRPMPSGGGGAMAFAPQNGGGVGVPQVNPNAAPAVLSTGGVAKPDAQGVFDANAVMLPPDQAQPMRMAQAGIGAPTPNSSATPQQGAPPQPNSAQTFPPQAARLLAAIANPDLPDSSRQAMMLVLQRMLPEDNKIMNLPDGTIVAVNARTNQVTPIYQGAKPTFTQIGEDMFGNKKFGFVDPTKMRVTDQAGNAITGANAGGAGSIPAGPDGAPLQGQDLLAHLEKTDPVAAAGVKGLLAGNTNAGARNLQKLAPLASLVDPTFSMATFPQRVALQKSYLGGGKNFQEMQAIDTVAGHLVNLANASDALNNGRFPMLNSVLNGVLSATGDPRVDRFNTVKQAVSNELSKAYRGGHVTEGDVREWQSNINSAKSPDQLRTVIGEFNDLLMSKRKALEDGYKLGMGPTPLPAEFNSTSQHAQDAFNQVLDWAHGGAMPGKASAAPPSAPASQPGAPPDRAAVEAARADPAGTLQQARDAIAAGKPRDAIVNRLRQLGIDATGL
jgi:hypothetical protein